MIGPFFIFVVFLFILAIALQETSVVTVIYFLLGAFLFGRWWRDRGLSSIDVRRRLHPQALLGETIRVRLEVANRGWLPVPWVRIHESLPVELSVPNFFRRAVALGPKGKTSVDYLLRGNKRGYYRIGPVYLQSGDLLGLEESRERQAAPDYLTVFPRIVPIPKCPIPSFSPNGTLRFHQPLFEDASRVMAKRDYQAGDSLRRIDWKASAAAGKLQVRQYDPAIALEVAVFLNLCAREYEPRTRIDAAELAVVTAASLAAYAAGKRQPVGLVSNGQDPLNPESRIHALPVRKGSAHLALLLQTLARIQLADGESFAALLRERGSGLPWGTTLLVITGKPDELLFDELLRGRRRGLQSVVFLTAPVLRYEAFESRARGLGIPYFEIRFEDDLKRILGRCRGTEWNPAG
ncbi:MAG: DUF58 domain-containing protein [Anaerolineales bacterium]|nr:DUF58 domain-containing protein [Anaerolineales bacterium]